MQERFERFSRVISGVSYALHKIAAKELEKYGLKGPYALYLLTVYRHPEGITATGISELCNRDKSDVSRAMTAMEKQGLLKKSTKAIYRAKITLTELGIEAAEQINRLSAAALCKIDENLDPEKLAVMYTALEAILGSLEKMIEEGIPANEQSKI